MESIEFMIVEIISMGTAKLRAIIMFPWKILYPIKMLTGNDRMRGEKNEVDLEFLIHRSEHSSGPTDADSMSLTVMRVRDEKR
jgi:hypothetical protein